MIHQPFSIDQIQDLDYIAIIGPTGVGKSGYAIQLAQQYPNRFEIVSVDSVQVYRGLDIGSAKVDLATRKDIKHHLIDICDADARYTAAQFATDAIQAVGDIRQRGKTALLVGGTFLYLQAFTEGLSPVDPVTDQARAKVAEIHTRGVAMAWHTLNQVDPMTAKRLAPQDWCRIERALLVYFSTNQPISMWQAKPRRRGHNYQGITLAVWPKDRAVLKENLAMRFDHMLDHGLIDEVKQCWDKYPKLTVDHPSMRAIGYRQVSAYVQGKCDYTKMRHDGIVATRRYCKRQLTWLRSMQNIHTSFIDPKQWDKFWGLC